MVPIKTEKRIYSGVTTRKALFVCLTVIVTNNIKRKSQNKSVSAIARSRLHFPVGACVLSIHFYISCHKYNLLFYHNKPAVPTSPARAASLFCRIKNIGSTSCDDFTQITSLRAVTTSWYKWENRPYAPNPDYRTMNWDFHEFYPFLPVNVGETKSKLEWVP